MGGACTCNTAMRAPVRSRACLGCIPRAAYRITIRGSIVGTRADLAEVLMSRAKGGYLSGSGAEPAAPRAIEGIEGPPTSR